MAKISKSDCEGNIYDLDVQLYDLTQERIYLEQVDSGEATQRIIQIDRYYTDLLEDRKYWEDMLYSGEYENYEWTGSGNTEKDKRNSTPVSMPNDLYHTDQKATAVDLKTPVALDAPIEAPIHVSPTKVFKNPVFTDLRTPVSLGNIVHSSVGTSLEPPLVLSKGDSDLSSPASKQSLLHNNSPKHAFQIPATSDIYTPVSLGNDVPGSVASPLEPPWVPSKGGAVLSSPASTQFLLQNNAPKNLYYDSSKIQISNSSASNRDSQISFLSESSSHNQQNPLDMHQVYAVNNVIQPQKDNVQILRKTERKEQQKRGMTRKHWIMVIIVFLILALVAVVLSLLLTKKGNNDSVTGDTSNSPSSPKTTPSATKPPRPAPTSFSKAYSVTTLASNVQEPAGIRIDPLSGNLIVSEYTANIFLKITPSGSRSVFVGSGTAGLRDGSGRSSQFTNVTAFAINSIGTIYATGCQLIDLDFVNNVIRVITKDGDVSTILRNSVSNPSGICVDNQDNLYLADAGNSRVIKIDTANGNAITQVGPTLRPAPNGLAVDYDGNFYYTTTDDNIIYRMDASASFSPSPFVGSRIGSSDGTGLQSSFNQPLNLIFDKSNYLYVADYGNSMVRKVNLESKQVLTISRSFRNPHDMVVDSNGLVYVADENDKSVKILTPTS